MTDKTFTPVAKLDDVPAGAKLQVEAGGIDLLLCNTKDRIFAIRNLCSHAFETLECGRMKSGWIACPVHGARFDLETGRPMNPPATVPIDTFEVRVVDGMVEVAV